MSMLLAAYAGPSMNPTLRQPELIEVVPYAHRPVHAGDVVCVLSPNGGHPVVHRVVRMTPAGMFTRGDNNTHADSRILQPEHIAGQVVAVWRGHAWRQIPAGLRGRMTSRWLRWRRIAGKGVSPLLHPLYHALSRRGFIARFLPAPFRPRVVVFRSDGQDHLRLLFRHHIIGRYDDETRRWQIQRPFRLFVHERGLPRPGGLEPSPLCCVIEDGDA